MSGHIFFHIKENEINLVRNRTPSRGGKGCHGSGKDAIFVRSSCEVRD